MCATEASAAGLVGTFRALLATVSASAVSRFDATGARWVRIDGIPIVGTAAELATSRLSAPITVHANGSYVSARSNWNAWLGASDLSSPGTPFTTFDGWTGTNANSGMDVVFADSVIASYGSCSGNCDGLLFCLEQ